MEVRSDALVIGTQLKGHTYSYRIEKVLGQGSFGITYLTTTHIKTKTIIKGTLGDVETDVEQDVRVAIKEFFMEEANSRSYDGSTVEGTSGELTDKYRKKFRKEAENLSHLKHSNIVKVLEVFDANNTTYYAMQYIDGQNLDDYIKSKGYLEEKEAIRIIRRVCKALQYMHEQKMLHLDLKPKNIMLDVNKKPYLIDFGLSKQYTKNGKPESSTSVGLGTPGYAPIEQADYKQNGSFPATLDIYALGATMYKMVVGQAPPIASDVLAYGLSMPDRISSDIQSFIINSMKPIRTERIQTASEFLVRLPNTNPHSDDTVVDKEKESSSSWGWLASPPFLYFIYKMIMAYLNS